MRPLRDVRDVLAAGAVRAVFQPIVELESGDVIAYESLARGPRGGALEAPEALFASARALGLLRALDAACSAAAIEQAGRIGLRAPLSLFVNVEPEVLDGPALDGLVATANASGTDLDLVFEVTERSVTSNPAELLHTIERIRALGWRIALDDVGADTASLAFMPLLRPEVVKLDLRLVQQRPTRQASAIMHAVSAYAEESGARVLAEGIEDEAHVALARGLGADLGQGWLYGRPAGELSPRRARDGRLPRFAPWTCDAGSSPFSAIPASTPLRIATKVLLVELSKNLEREALAHGTSAVVIAAFQHAHHFTASTARRYAALAAGTSFVGALGEGLPQDLLPGVRGAHLAADDPVIGEWDIVVLTPHFSAALLARDLGDDGPDADRRFEYALTYRREHVVRAATALLARVAPERRQALPRAA